MSWKMCFGIARKPRQESAMPAGYQQQLPNPLPQYSDLVAINRRNTIRWVASNEQQTFISINTLGTLAWNAPQVSTRIMPPLEIEATPVERREHPELELDPDKKEIPPVPAFARKIDFEDK